MITRMQVHDILHLSNFSIPSLSPITKRIPVFYIHSSKIKILKGPKEFYDELLLQSSKSVKRITIASLYLGNGNLEKKLVSVMSERLDSERALKINWLLDFTRASRGLLNSRTMLLPLLKKSDSNCTVSLFHTPNLRGLYKWLIPERFNEVIGLQHMKVYIFDDSVIISGANLSNDYFVNRQDRYFVLNDCKELADFYNKLIMEVSRHCFQLKSNDDIKLGSDSALHPYKGNYKDYCKKFRDGVLRVWVNESQDSYERLKNFFLQLEEKRQDPDPLQPNTLVFPTIQMAQFGITEDSEVTLDFLNKLDDGSRIHLATGYFNLTEQYVERILRTFYTKYDILCAHPKANGFFGARGLAGGIPAAYTNLCRKFYEKIQETLLPNRVRIFEYQKEGWTFHAKGFWYFQENEATPSTTIIGSPNFGYRSMYRDLETQLLVSTSCPNLRQKFLEEERSLFENSNMVSKNTFNSPDRKVPLWVQLVTYFMKYFF